MIGVGSLITFFQTNYDSMTNKIKSMINYIPQQNFLSNKTILVTGAGAGIGKQAALSYAAHGATVILLGRTVKKLEQTYDEIIAANHPQPAIVPLDLKGASKQNYQDMCRTIIDQFQQLDGLLLNASALGVLSPLEFINESTWNEVIQVNVTAQFLMVQALMPALKQATHASVVFTSSSVGTKGRAYWGPYSVSKFATIGLMETLSDEFEKTSIRFNSINPGATRTAMRSKAYPGEDAKLLKTPLDIMPSYLYLMGDDSLSVKGQNLQAQ